MEQIVRFAKVIANSHVSEIIQLAMAARIVSLSRISRMDRKSPSLLRKGRTLPVKLNTV